MLCTQSILLMLNGGKIHPPHTFQQRPALSYVLYRASDTLSRAAPRRARERIKREIDATMADWLAGNDENGNDDNRGRGRGRHRRCHRHRRQTDRFSL